VAHIRPLLANVGSCRCKRHKRAAILFSRACA
jgi:hypothetical protein